MEPITLRAESVTTVGAGKMIKIVYKKDAQDPPKGYVERLASGYNPRGPRQIIYSNQRPCHFTDRPRPDHDMSDNAQNYTLSYIVRSMPYKETHLLDITAPTINKNLQAFNEGGLHKKRSPDVMEDKDLPVKKRGRVRKSNSDVVYVLEETNDSLVKNQQKQDEYNSASEDRRGEPQISIYRGARSRSRSAQKEDPNVARAATGSHGEGLEMVVYRPQRSLGRRSSPTESPNMKRLAIKSHAEGLQMEHRSSPSSSERSTGKTKNLITSKGKDNEELKMNKSRQAVSSTTGERARSRSLKRLTQEMESYVVDEDSRDELKMKISRQSTSRSRKRLHKSRSPVTSTPVANSFQQGSRRTRSSKVLTNIDKESTVLPQILPKIYYEPLESRTRERRRRSRAGSTYSEPEKRRSSKSPSMFVSAVSPTRLIITRVSPVKTRGSVEYDEIQEKALKDMLEPELKNFSGFDECDIVKAEMFKNERLDKISTPTISESLGVSYTAQETQLKPPSPLKSSPPKKVTKSADINQSVCENVSESDQGNLLHSVKGIVPLNESSEDVEILEEELPKDLMFTQSNIFANSSEDAFLGFSQSGIIDDDTLLFLKNNKKSCDDDCVTVSISKILNKPEVSDKEAEVNVTATSSAHLDIAPQTAADEVSNRKRLGIEKTKEEAIIAAKTPLGSDLEVLKTMPKRLSKAETVVDVKNQDISPTGSTAVPEEKTRYGRARRVGLSKKDCLMPSSAGSEKQIDIAPLQTTRKSTRLEVKSTKKSIPHNESKKASKKIGRVSVHDDFVNDIVLQLEDSSSLPQTESEHVNEIVPFKTVNIESDKTYWRKIEPEVAKVQSYVESAELSEQVASIEESLGKFVGLETKISNDIQIERAERKTPKRGESKQNVYPKLIVEESAQTDIAFNSSNANSMSFTLNELPNNELTEKLDGQTDIKPSPRKTSRKQVFNTILEELTVEDTPLDKTEISPRKGSRKKVVKDITEELTVIAAKSNLVVPSELTERKISPRKSGRKQNLNRVLVEPSLEVVDISECPELTEVSVLEGNEMQVDQGVLEEQAVDVTSASVKDNVDEEFVYLEEQVVEIDEVPVVMEEEVTDWTADVDIVSTEVIADVEESPIEDAVRDHLSPLKEPSIGTDTESPIKTIKQADSKLAEPVTTITTVIAEVEDIPTEDLKMTVVSDHESPLKEFPKISAKSPIEAIKVAEPVTTSPTVIAEGDIPKEDAKMKLVSKHGSPLKETSKISSKSPMKTRKQADSKLAEPVAISAAVIVEDIEDAKIKLVSKREAPLKEAPKISTKSPMKTRKQAVSKLPEPATTSPTVNAVESAKTKVTRNLAEKGVPIEDAKIKVPPSKSPMKTRKQADSKQALTADTVAFAANKTDVVDFKNDVTETTVSHEGVMVTKESNLKFSDAEKNDRFLLVLVDKLKGDKSSNSSQGEPVKSPHSDVKKLKSAELRKSDEKPNKKKEKSHRTLNEKLETKKLKDIPISVEDNKDNDNRAHRKRDEKTKGSEGSRTPSIVKIDRSDKQHKHSDKTIRKSEKHQERTKIDKSVIGATLPVDNGKTSGVAPVPKKKKETTEKPSTHVNKAVDKKVGDGKVKVDLKEKKKDGLVKINEKRELDSKKAQTDKVTVHLVNVKLTDEVNKSLTVGLSEQNSIPKPVATVVDTPTTVGKEKTSKTDISSPLQRTKSVDERSHSSKVSKVPRPSGSPPNPDKKQGRIVQCFDLFGGLMKTPARKEKKESKEKQKRPHLIVNSLFAPDTPWATRPGAPKSSDDSGGKTSISPMQSKSKPISQKKSSPEAAWGKSNNTFQNKSPGKLGSANYAVSTNFQTESSLVPKNSVKAAKKLPSNSAQSPKVSKSPLDPSSSSFVIKDGILLVDPRLPAGWKREIRHQQCGRIEVYLESPDGRKFRRRLRLQEYLTEKNLPYNADDFDFSLTGKLKGNESPPSQPSKEIKKARILKRKKSHDPSEKSPPKKPKLVETSKVKEKLAPTVKSKLVEASNVKAKAKKSSIKITVDELEEEETEEISEENVVPMSKEEASEFYRKILSNNSATTKNTVSVTDKNPHFIETTANALEMVRGLALGANLGNERSDRRLSFGVKNLNCSISKVEETEEHIPAEWVKGLANCRPGMTSLDGDAALSIATATESFLQRLASFAFQNGEGPNLSYEDIAEIVAETPSLKPLRTLIPRKITFRQFHLLNRPTKYFSFKI